MEGFYWRHGQDNILTDAAVRMFQILAQHDGEDFDQAKHQIDNEYKTLTGKSDYAKHGGLIQTWLRAYQEAGWVELAEGEGQKKTIKITDAGKQALVLLAKLPDFLKVVPYFIVQLLPRIV